MPADRYPGVYVEEIPRGPHPIEGVATATAAFVGSTARTPGKGPAATVVTSYAEFAQVFGDPPPESAIAQHLAHAVRLFFSNGGQRCFIARAVSTAAAGQSPTVEDLVGRDDGPGHRSGVHALEDIPEMLTIAAPGCTDTTVQQALIDQCERRRDRFAILDCEPASARPAGLAPLVAHRRLFETSFAAYYGPWLSVSEEGRRVVCPPSGAVAGVIARVDLSHGVWKAPTNEVVHGVDGLDAAFSDADQDVLSPEGISTIRAFAGRGIRVWGARTLSHDPEWKYVNVRRFLMFLERSIEQGTRWVVFEPNSAPTWHALVTAVEDFLLRLSRQGALHGRVAHEAFFVRCDRSTMTQNDLDNGRLICEVGVAPVRPAEFVIFRIGQWTVDAK